MNSQSASMSEHQTIEWKEVWRDEYLKAYISYEGVQRVERLLGKHPSNPYNPLIANTFFRCGYIESWGVVSKRSTVNVNSGAFQHPCMITGCQA
ncbi:MAG: hypothetical protein BWK73_53655 [Thiothrix lacustris]|uniref:Uncharacterized protein n=1 Tax=Thiothrix lacustris TaxID=525917 RepID=A0A1Y1Q720_9GAMM|nr:MAG: hypothetical protein BWK73_53655 [Thiothrix lacustris]